MYVCMYVCEGGLGGYMNLIQRCKNDKDILDIRLVCFANGAAQINITKHELHAVWY